MSIERRDGVKRSGMRWPLRLHILGAFLLLFGVVAVTVGVVTSRSTQHLVDETVAASFEGGSDLALQELGRLDETARSAAEALAAHPIVDALSTADRRRHLPALAMVLRSVPGVSAAYVGWPDGAFVLLRPASDRSGRLDPPPAASWVAQWAGIAGAQFDFFDRDLNLIETRTDVDYPLNPRTRPWFIEATAAPETIVTAPYIFFTTREPGFTAARRAPSGAVAGVDVSLWDLSARLPADQPVASVEAAVLTGDGGLLAYSAMDRLEAIIDQGATDVDVEAAERLPPAEAADSAVLSAMADRLRDHPAAYSGRIATDQREWLAEITPLGADGTAFLAMATPMDEIARRPAALRAQLFQIFGLAVLLMLPLLWYAARRISWPVEAFVDRVESAARLEFDPKPPVRTTLGELVDLDGAIRGMRGALACYTTVCRSIVEQEDPDVLLDALLKAMLDAAGADGGAVWLAAGSGGGLRLAAHRGDLNVAGAPYSGPDSGPGSGPESAEDDSALARRIVGEQEVSTFVCKGTGNPLAIMGIPLRSASGRIVGAFALARRTRGDADHGDRLWSAESRSLAVFISRAGVLALDRQHMIAELAATRREVELILDTVVDGIIVLDEDGCVRRQNPAARTMLGWSDERLLGRSWHDTIQPTSRPGSQSAAACLADGQTRRDAAGVFQHGSGTPVSIAFESSALRRPDGSVAGAVVSFRDLGELQRSQHELRERIKELHCLYRVVEVTADQERSVPEVAQSIARLLPASLAFEAHAVARLVLDADSFYSDGWREPEIVFRSDIHRGADIAGTIEIGYRDIEALTPTGDRLISNEEKSMLDAVADHVSRMLSGRQMAAMLRQTERMSAVGELTGGVAHDFNNLLTVILGNAALLEERSTGSPEAGALEVARLAAMIVHAAERGAQLTNQLLSFARRQPLAPEPTAVDRLIAAMIDLLRRTLGESIEVSVSASEDVARALVDPAQLESAILNLCLNARDAMPDGGRLTIDIANAEKGPTGGVWPAGEDEADQRSSGPYVLISVTDTGAGIPPDILDRVCEPFFSTKEAGKGGGLGLSMVYGFIRQSRGLIRIASVVGEGTAVRLYLPKAPFSDAGASDAGPPAGAPAGGDEHILLVEDNDLVRAFAEGLLVSLGYRVTVAADAHEALEKAETSTDIDLLFTDIVMPGGMDGIALAAAFRQTAPSVPVLFTTGYTDTPKQGEVDGLAGETIVRKPFRRLELATKVRQMLDSVATAG